jgi:hypothetical protein
MLATARLTGQTIGAIPAAISFRIAGHSETTALGMAAALAAIAAVASGARLYHPEGAPGETSNRRRRAVTAPVFESDKRLSATAVQSVPAIKSYSERILSLP